MMRLISRTRERQARDDEGFSIIELMMSLTILMVGIIAILGTLVVAVKASGLQRHRLNAVQVANEAMEKVRAQLYSNLALDPDDPNYGERPPSSMAPPPTEAVEAAETVSSIPVAPPQLNRDGVIFDIRQNVLWVSYTDPVTALGYAHAYKHVVIRVFWTDQVGTHDYTVESDVYPGNLGAQTPDWCGDEPAGPIIFPPAAPSGVIAQFSLPDESQALITWNDNSSDECWFEWATFKIPSSAGLTDCSQGLLDAGYLLQSPDRPFTMSNSALHYVGELAPSTTHCFRIRAKNIQDDGQYGLSDWAYSNALTTTDSSPGTDSCTIVSVMLRSPAGDPDAPQYRVKLKSNNENQDTIVVGVTTSGECSAVWADFTVTSPASIETVPLTLSFGTWSAELPVQWKKFATGNGYVSIGATSVYPPDPSPYTQSVCYYKTSQC